MHNFIFSLFHPSRAKCCTSLSAAHSQRIYLQKHAKVFKISVFHAQLVSRNKLKDCALVCLCRTKNFTLTKTWLWITCISTARILHVVGIATRFGNAAVLSGSSAADVRDTFVANWATVYPGYPNKLSIDSGSVFKSPHWTRCADSARIQLQVSGAESHSSLGLGERYHTASAASIERYATTKCGHEAGIVALREGH